MIDIAVQDLNQYYGSNHVLKGISFEVYSGEKIGLLGKNGSGKTTLFKTITGEEPYESGSIAKASGKKVEMLAQIPVFAPTDTAGDVLRASFREISDVYAAMKKIEGDDTPEVLARYGRLMSEYERLGGYDMEIKLNKVCTGTNIDERMMQSLFNQLSGGEQTRVNLARILLRDCDILLLDEPTNHLDLATLEWLEKFLSEFLGTVVVISHDRVFLDHVVTRIIEIDDGKANFYAGNYSFYVEERAQRFLTQAELFKQQQRKIKQLEVAIKRQRVWAQANPSNTGLAKRALAMEKRIEQMEKVDKPVTDRKLTGAFDSGGYASKEVLAFTNVQKSYGTKVLLHNLNQTIRKNEHIALIGPNGCGKTTLLQMITGAEPCDSGAIKIGASIKCAYMPQIVEFENRDATVLETLRFHVDVSEEKARSILAGFHFRAADVIKKVGVLSGGEKSRLKLCLLMQNDVNFLLLDEPTNHLDIASREWIENALADFEGTMMFVSHDRYFLSKFADQVWGMENGAITRYEYGFDEYMEAMHAAENQSKKAKQPTKTQKPAQSAKLASTETLIANAEEELQKVNAALQAYLHTPNSLPIGVLHQKKRELEKKIDALYAKWMEEN